MPILPVGYQAPLGYHPLAFQRGPLQPWSLHSPGLTGLAPRPTPVGALPAQPQNPWVTQLVNAYKNYLAQPTPRSNPQGGPYSVPRMQELMHALGFRAPGT